jgi:hypothetical protein
MGGIEVRLRIRVKVLGAAMCLVMGASGLWYIFASRSAANWSEIVIGSVMLSILVGMVSSFVDKILAGPLEKRVWVGLGLTGSISLVCVSVLLFLGNMPEPIKKEIPVTYLVNMQTGELAPVRSQETTSVSSYSEARIVWKQFMGKDPNTAELIRRSLGEPGQGGDFLLVMRSFRDLTEYVVVKALVSRAITPEAEYLIYRRETPGWLAIPDKEIRGEKKGLDVVRGFTDNPFSGLPGWFPDKAMRLDLPVGTKIRIERDDFYISRIIIQNKYLTIRIGVQMLVVNSGWPARPEPSMLEIYADNVAKRGPFKQYSAVVYYDVEFDRLRYGFRNMERHQRWANDLFGVLERSLTWGNPRLVDLYEEIRRYEEAQSKGLGSERAREVPLK